MRRLPSTQARFRSPPSPAIGTTLTVREPAPVGFGPTVISMVLPAVFSNGAYTLVGGFWALPTAVQTPGAPLLGVEPLGSNKVRVFWPLPATGFVLDQTAALATPLGVALLAAGLVVASLTASWAPVIVLAIYVALQPLYTYWLKHIAVIDLLVVASGFVLRAVAGVVGTDVPISDWYLIVASFGSLFLVAGKRSSELRIGAEAVDHRRSLEAYTPSFLLLVRSVAVGITLLAYCLWAFEKSAIADSWFPWFELSIVPFTALLLRYALAHESAELAGPEDIVLGDRQLQVIGVVWAACLVAGVYGAGTPPLSG